MSFSSVYELSLGDPKPLFTRFSMSEPLARAHIFLGFDAYASRRGLDFDSLLSSAGLSRQDIADPDNEISLNSAANLLTTAAMESADPCFGLHWAELYPKGGSGVLGYLLLHSGTVRDAVQALARYNALLVDPLDARFQEGGGVGRLEWRFPSTFTAPRIQYAAFAAALTISRLRNFTGNEWSPLEVQLEHRELPCRADVERMLGANVLYDCPVNSIHISEAVLNRPNANADPRLYALIRQLGDRLLDERKSNTDIVLQTRSAIVKKLDSGDVTLEAVAESMNFSPRVLQARLASAGTNFETILQDTRQGLAETYLRDTDLALTEIAFLLGFSELSAFTRASHRWFGVPPSERRTVLRRQTG